ncbi:ATP-binding protein [Flammeovirgaceae bacterium SG7u.111]|nr:ATP-binding protein [Flammeovirgaceae bacterium SG7u.132]WPO33472.1 ATP-binding protein [Flammeovirgaceae bacterium SG7u.111]
MFKKLSIKGKLIGVILTVTLFAVLAGFTSFYFILNYSLKQDLHNSMVTNAKLIAEFCVGPMEFNRKQFVEKEVLDRLNNIPEVECATIFGKDNEVFATYNQGCEIPSKFTMLAENTAVFEGENFYIVQRIEFEGEFYGRVILKISTQLLTDKLQNFILLISGVVAIIVVLSLIFANAIQGVVSKPVKNLADAASKVSDNADYSLRVQKESEDEIGDLYDSFNHMLEQIEARSAAEAKSKKALQLSESKFRNIYQNSMVGIFRYDLRTGLLMEGNDRTWQILGTNLTQKSAFGDMLNIRDGVKIKQELDRSGLIDGYELFLRKENGEKIWLSLSGRSFKEENFFEGVIKDVTEEKESFLEIKRVNFELDNFVYHTSHDLRSPLLSIQGLISICKNEESLDSIREYFDLIERSVKRLDNLVLNLLTLSRNTRVDNKHEIIDFKNQIEESVNILRFNNTQDVEVKIDVKDGVEFYSDNTRLSIIISNLVSNAFKYQNPSKDEQYVHISVESDDKEAVIKVKDNGMGIPPNSQAKIFEMFYRATDQSHGSGLGLFIVKNVVDKLKGKISFQSSVREGTTFTVVVPNSPNEEKENTTES